MLKSTTTTYKSNITAYQQNSNAIKCYLRMQNYSGNQQATSCDYQILDDNTMMLKDDLEKLSFKMYGFSYIFNTTVSHHLIASSLGIIDDLFDGYNQMLIIHGGTASELLLGSTEQNGLVIELFSLIHNQVKQPYQVQSKLFFSVYSTELDKNFYIDLLIGQRYKYFSKKGLQQKFYEKQLTSQRDFLIGLKIAITRYNQCCSLDDPLIIKFTLEHYDEHKQRMLTSMLTIAYTNQNQKLLQSLLAKMDALCIQQKIKRLEDGGDITNFLESTIKSSKIVVLCSLLNNKPTIKRYSNILDFISKYQGKTNLNIKKISKIPINYQEQLNNHSQQSHNLRPCNALKNLQKTKIVTKLQTLTKSYELFTKECVAKLLCYLQLLQKQYKIAKQSYSRIQFSVSLQIKQNSTKQFHIAKLYKLSENYKMEDLTSLHTKLKVLKNQILVAVKTQENHYFNSENSIEELQQYYQVMQAKLKIIKKFIKLIFSMSCRKTQNICINKININALFQIAQFKNILRTIDRDYKTQNTSITIRKLTEQSKISKNSSFLSNQTAIIRSNSKSNIKKTGSLLPRITIPRKQQYI